MTDATVRSQHLARALTEAMRAGGFTGQLMAEKLGWSGAKVSKLLTGKRRPSLVDLSAFLAVCGVIGSARDALLGCAKDLDEPGWCEEHGECLPADLVTLRHLEDIATSVTCVDAVFVPTLGQTENYRRALLRANPVIWNDEVDDRLAHHRKRQHVLERAAAGRDGRAKFRFFIDERSLSTAGPDRDIMSEQVHHLLRMAVRPQIEIRVVPASRVLLGTCAPFQLMTFADLHPVIYLEHLNSTVLLEQTATVAGYRRVLNEIHEIALDRQQTHTWLATRAAMLGEPTPTLQPAMPACGDPAGWTPPPIVGLATTNRPEPIAWQSPPVGMALPLRLNPITNLNGTQTCE